MKKYILIFLLTFGAFSLDAQWTDSGSNLTTSDNVGIGNTNPLSKLQVNSYTGSGTAYSFGSITSFANSGDIGLYLGVANENIGARGWGFSVRSVSVNSSLDIIEKGLNGTRITIASGGLVGIGETNPSSKLHITGPDLWLKLQDSNANSYATTNAGIQFNNSYATVGQIFQVGEDLALETTGSFSNLLFKTQSTERLRINKDGNVGIGTTSPQTKLHIQGTTSTYSRIANSGGNTRLTFGAVTGRNIIYSQTYNGEAQILKLQVNNENNFVIDTNGNIGIGTVSTDSHKLAVEGSIGARKIKVEATGWSDFVFENDYHLRPLEEVEQFISNNKHLPEIPSAQDVKRNGIDLGQMDSKLLMKIEELTLYLIEQNKQNQAQQARIEQLEKELEALKNK